MSVKTLYGVALDITYGCTMNCVHCFNSSGGNRVVHKELSDEDWMILVKDIIQLKPDTVCICGGEPLTRKNLLLKIIAYIKNSEYGNIIQVNFVSNGELIDEQTAKEIKEAGTDLVQISLDGHNNETCKVLRNKENAFDIAIRAIKNLKKFNINTATAFVPHKLNYQHFSETYKIQKELGVKMIRLQPLMLLGRAKQYLKEYELSSKEYRALLKEVNLLKLKNKNSFPALEWGDPSEHFLNISRDIKNGVFVYTNTIIIDAYGNISASPYLPVKAGNIKKYSILKYWEDGLKCIWNSKLFSKYALMVNTTEDLDFSLNDNTIPELNLNETLIYDIIDDKEVYGFESII